MGDHWRPRTEGEFVANFWRRVLFANGDACWVWTGALNAGGYGHTQWHDGKQHRAQRLSWELTRGPIPDGALVCHRCDNRMCVRPEHLFLGSGQDNVDDMRAKGRERKVVGESHPFSKATTDVVRSIRSRYRPYQVTAVALGKEFGLSEEAVRSILRGKTWKHVDSDQQGGRPVETETRR